MFRALLRCAIMSQASITMERSESQPDIKKHTHALTSLHSNTHIRPFIFEDAAPDTEPGGAKGAFRVRRIQLCKNVQG